MKNTRLIALSDGTRMGDTTIVFETNAPTEEFRKLERISNDIYINGGDYEDIPIWALVLTRKGYLCNRVDSCRNVTPYCTASDWLEDKFPDVKEHYVIENQPNI